MKTRTLALPLVLLSALSYQLSIGSCSAQGSLTPPGPPGATMLTLSQVEPRTPISSLPFIINSPGSYYFTTNVIAAPSSPGITINSSDVMIDLKGFELVGNGNGSGITTPSPVTNICVCNGTVRNWPAMALGVYYANNSRFEKLHLTDSTEDLVTGSNCVVTDCLVLNTVNSGNPALRISDGCVVRNCIVGGPSAWGILGDDNTVIESCLLSSNVIGIRVGLNSTIRNCSVVGCSTNAINTGTGATLIGCQSQGNAGTGFLVGSNSTLQDCVASSNKVSGFNSGSLATFRHCTANYNTTYGFTVGVSCDFNDCQAAKNGSRGFNAGVFCRFDGCQAANNGSDGIFADSHSAVLGCSANANLGYGINLNDYDQVQNCQANDNSSVGIGSIGHGQIINCQCSGNSAHGIYAQNGGAISGCVCEQNGESGIYINSGSCKVVDNTCDNDNTGNTTGEAGIYLLSSGSLVDGNYLVGNNGGGIAIALNFYTNNIIIRNNAFGNTPVDYSIASGNDAGPIGNAATATSPWANISN